MGFLWAVDVTQSLSGAGVVIKASGMAGTVPLEHAPAPAGTGPWKLPAVPGMGPPVAGSWGPWKVGIQEV